MDQGRKHNVKLLATAVIMAGTIFGCGGSQSGARSTNDPSSPEGAGSSATPNGGANGGATDGTGTGTGTNTPGGTMNGPATTGGNSGTSANMGDPGGMNGGSGPSGASGATHDMGSTGAGMKPGQGTMDAPRGTGADQTGKNKGTTPGQPGQLSQGQPR